MRILATLKTKQMSEKNINATSSLLAISPIDGRYYEKTKDLREYFSEFALIRYRIRVEIEYFIALCEIPLDRLSSFGKSNFERLRDIYRKFTPLEALRIKEIEKTTNHDVKAVEYYIKEQFIALNLEKYSEFVHFALTSQDINNTATPLSLKEGIEQIYMPVLEEVMAILQADVEEWKETPMLAHTHGQPASPTRLGKEIAVFLFRLKEQLRLLKSIPYSSKFGGATGNFNAHFLSYPSVDWNRFADNFQKNCFGLKRSFPTTQIEHYDNLAALFDNLKRINTILLDLCRDFWTYIQMEYFKQKIKAGEVGSSAMPHKVNPIDFENAEGNMGVANALFEHLSAKLPISRMQRDLTDSTVLRNIGVPLSHTIIALKSLIKGLKKLILNKEKLYDDLEQNWAVVAEGLQTILRREGYPHPYEALKALTRVNTKITQESIREFVEKLEIPEAVKQEMLSVTPHNYLGYNV